MARQTRKNRGTRRARAPAALKVVPTTRSSYKTKVKPTKSMLDVINTVVRRGQETKFVVGAPFNNQSSTNLETFTSFTSAITSTNEVYALIPKIDEGTDDFNRIGQVIQPRSLRTKVNVCLPTDQVHSMSVYADFYFCTAKPVKAEYLSNQVPTSELLNDGQGSNVPYDGTSFTAALPINKTKFSLIRHVRVKLQKGINDPNVALTGAGTSSTNVYPYSKSFSVNIPIPQKLTYLDSGSNTPSNFFPFMMVGFHGTDNTGGTAPIVARINVQAQSQLYYKDA